MFDVDNEWYLHMMSKNESHIWFNKCDLCYPVFKRLHVSVVQLQKCVV